MDTSKWTTSIPEHKVYVPAFDASEMGVNISSQNSYRNSNGNFTVNMVLVSNTNLTQLVVKLTAQNDSSLIFLENAIPRNDNLTYDVEFQNVAGGNYVLDMFADAGSLVGVVKRFSLVYLVN